MRVDAPGRFTKLPHMKPRNVHLSLLLVALLMLGAIWFSRHQPQARELVQRHPPVLRFTPVALCRLQCLGLQKADAEQIMATGLVLYHKSNRRATPCPVYVLQGSSLAGQSFRLGVEQCSLQSIVVFVEPTAADSACNCNVQ